MRTASLKGNNARKILSFYRINFGHEPPYQVLVDSETIQTALSNDLYIKQALPRLLGSATHIVVTSCIVSDLRAKGETHSNAALFAKRATRIPCAHDGQKSAADCITARLQTPHDAKLMVASNDPAIAKFLAGTPGIPHLSIMNKSKLVLRAPTKGTQLHIQKEEKCKTETLSGADKALVDKARAAERELKEARRGNIRKRKRAKGPNPLSVQKAKKKGAAVQPDAQAGNDAPKNVLPSVSDVVIPELHKTEKTGRKRTRKRSRKQQKGGSAPPDDDDAGTIDGKHGDEGAGNGGKEDEEPPSKKRKHNAEVVQSTVDTADEGVDAGAPCVEQPDPAPVNGKSLNSKVSKANETPYDRRPDAKDDTKKRQRNMVTSTVEGPLLCAKGMQNHTAAVEQVQEARDECVQNTSDGCSNQVTTIHSSDTVDTVGKRADTNKEQLLASSSLSIVRKQVTTPGSEENAETGKPPGITSKVTPTEEQTDEGQGVEISDKNVKKKHRKNRRRRPKKMAVDQEETTDVAPTAPTAHET